MPNLSGIGKKRIVSSVANYRLKLSAVIARKTIFSRE
jgi:hypothetical protein